MDPNPREKSAFRGEILLIFSKKFEKTVDIKELLCYNRHS